MRGCLALKYLYYLALKYNFMHYLVFKGIAYMPYIKKYVYFYLFSALLFLIVLKKVCFGKSGDTEPAFAECQKLELFSCKWSYSGQCLLQCFSLSLQNNVSCLSFYISL